MKLLTRLTLFFALSLCVQPLYSQGGSDIYYDSSNGEQTDSYLLHIPLEADPTLFSSVSDYNFSFVRYFRRGYEHYLSRTLADGIDVSDPFEASLYWNLLGGLSGMVRDGDGRFGIAPYQGFVGRIGEIEHYALSAGDRRRGGNVVISATDRRYLGGMRVGLSTGWTDSGWALSFAGSRRFGHDGHIKGVFSDDWGVYGSVAKKIDTRNTVSASFIMSPTQRGAKGASTMEAFQLYGDNFYNPYWGYQDGKVRSSRVREENIPMGILTWKSSPSADFDITTSLSAAAGSISYSSLDWYGTGNPLPDYYRNMPGFFADPDISEAVAEQWQAGNGKVTGVDWAELYYVNRSGAGFGPASYILRSDVRRLQNFEAVSFFRYRIDRMFTLRAGIRGRKSTESRFSRLDDLMGAEYVKDIDQYLVDDERYGQLLLNDMRSPDRVVVEGDRFGYDYSLDHNYYGGWGILEIGREHGSGRLSGYAAIEAGEASFRRKGNYEKELFAGDASFGPSEEARFTEYMLKGGVKFIPRPSNILSLDVAYGDMAPGIDEIFLSPRYRNAFAGEPRAANLLAGELSYSFTKSSFGLTITGHAASIRGGNEVRRYYDDIASEFCNAVIYDVGKLYSGVELSVFIAITPRLDLRLAGAKSYNVYLNDPQVEIFSDKSGLQAAFSQRSYIKAYRIGGTPQTAAAGELRYSGRRQWSVSATLNMVGDNYVSLNPVRRMKRVFNNVASGELVGQIASQERFAPATTVDLFVRKGFNLKGGGYLSLICSVENIANRKDIIYSGYEQMRLARSGVGAAQFYSPFPSKYLFAYGRTFYVTVNYSF